MRQITFAVLMLALLLPVQASALQADDLVAIAAMPLAVAAVSELTDVPANDLMDLVATLNQAQVPAPQFIEVVRFSPVALADTREPFVPYVTQEVERGVRGEQLALAIEDRIERYDGAQSIDVANAPRVVVIDRAWYPQVVVTRFQPLDPLSLAAMPLAVAAASEITDVPSSELVSLVRLLNEARVPAPQFVEIVRYSPVALVDRDPAFLTFVTTEVSSGNRGMTLARLIDTRYDTLGLANVDVLNPPVLTDVIVPPVVTTRVAAAREHPHGGPPGQLKKELGLQTGAEVVHGTHPGRAHVAERKANKPAHVTRHVEHAPKVKHVQAPKVEHVHVPKVEHVRPPKVEHVQKQVATPKPAKAHGNSGGNAGGNAGGNGKGKGKGH